MEEREILLKETIEEIDIYLPKMINGIQNFVEYIMHSRGHEAQTLLTNIFEGLEWIVQAIQLTNEIKTGKMNEQDLVKKLPMLIEAYENRDFILISDILDYEIKPILEKWTHQIH